MGEKKIKKLLLIGWDAADWNIINPLIKQGKMPTLAKFLSEGSHGPLKTLDPPLSPILWTSIATGMRADKHGITGFVEPLADESGMRPVTSTSRKVKAIWNILNQNDYKSNVVAWWPSNPVEPINGVMVSNLFQVANKPLKEKWECPPKSVHPEVLTDTLKKFRVHPGELTANHLGPFVPNLENIDMKEDKRLQGVAKIIANAATVHSVSTFLQRRTEWDFMAVYHDAVDHFCHLTMKFRPPIRPGIPEDIFNNYKDVVDAGYMFHDMMLERTLELADEDTTVMLISDHGFHADHLRPMQLVNEPAAPAQEHSPYGIVAMRGPGIKKGGLIHNGSVIDVTPTILAMYGLPIGQDMEGKPLVEAFDFEYKPEFIPSWEEVEGNSGMHPSDLVEDVEAAKEAMEQLIELGYIERPGKNIGEQIQKIKNEGQYYVARNLMEKNEYNKAREILERIFDETEYVRYGQRLAHLYLVTKQYKKCRTLIDRLKDLSVRLDKAEKDKTEEEKEKSSRSFMREIDLPNYIDFVEGMLFMHLNRPRKAMLKFREVEKKVSNSLELFLNIGSIANQRHLWNEAETSFIKALSVEPTNPVAHHGLGTALLRQDKIEEAIDELLIAIEMNPYLANAHYHLGEALVKLERYEDAINAFNIAISLVPGMTKAHKWLIEIYSNEVKDDERLAQHKEFIKQNIKGDITIVTGLPHAGSTLLMEKLNQEGYNVSFDDAIIENDDKNSYLLNETKRLRGGAKWMSNYIDSIIKVPIDFLPYLPMDYNYHILYCNSPISEVMDAQLKEAGKTKALELNAFPSQMHNTLVRFEGQAEAWLRSHPKINVLEIEKDSLLNEWEEELERITIFSNVLKAKTNKV